MAAPKRDNARAARILAGAAFTSDAKACEDFKITLRTLQNYRAALKTDPELSHLFASACADLAQRDWADELGLTLSAATQKLRALILGAQDSDPATIEAVTSAVLGLAETALTRDLLAARLQQGEGPQLSPRSALVTSKQVN